MNDFIVVSRCTRHRAAHKIKEDEVELDKYSEEDKQI